MNQKKNTFIFATTLVSVEKRNTKKTEGNGRVQFVVKLWAQTGYMH